MFRELKLSITDEESHLNMRLDALLSDVMTAGWRVTLASVTASSTTCAGGRQRGLRRRRSRSRIRIYWFVRGHASDGRRTSHQSARLLDPH